jgi:FkbM family methyltransferase
MDEVRSTLNPVKVRAVLGKARDIAVSRVRSQSRTWRCLKVLWRALPRQLKPTTERKRESQIRQIIDSFSRARKDVYFIQIGSGDGVAADPLHEFIVRDGWSGILVEPVKYVFERLVANYRRNEKLIFENVAISDTVSRRVLWYLRENDDDLPYWYDQIGSFSRQHVEKHSSYIPDVEKYIAKQEVECLTFDALIRKHNVERLDLLHVDAEGYDFDIIKQVDFGLFQPKIILYEHMHLSEQDLRMCRDYLGKKGYREFREGADTIALKA